tara:strand:+ start:21 stop:308 length:288 start_codon:yes stop_codon:yes gene_type:complete
MMMMHCAFESCYGYNTSVRTGKIYHFSDKALIYILEINHDLKMLNHNFKVLSRQIKKYLLIKKIRRYFTPHYLFEIQIGIRTMRQTIEEIKKKHL